MTTGEKIQLQRKKKGYTQDDLASILEVSRQSVSKWESDTAFPETDKLIELSNIFGCSIDYLLKENQEETPEINNEDTKDKETKNNFFTNLVHKEEFFTSCFLVGYSLISLLLFIIPIAKLAVAIPYSSSSYYIFANLYEVAFSSNYEFGNLIFTLMFFLVLGVLGLGIAYMFKNNKKLYLLAKIFIFIELGFGFLGFLFFAIASALSAGTIVLTLFNIATVILLYVLPQNKVKHIKNITNNNII